MGELAAAYLGGTAVSTLVAVAPRKGGPVADAAADQLFAAAQQPLTGPYF